MSTKTTGQLVSLLTLTFVSYLTVISSQEISAPVASVQTNQIMEGDTVILKCGYTSDKIAYVVWYYRYGERNSKTSLFAYNKEYPSETNGTNAWAGRAFGRVSSEGYYVELQNITVADDAEYVCHIDDSSYGRNPKESNPLNIEVAVEPSPAELQNKGSLVAYASQLSNFSCIIHRAKPRSNIAIDWYLGSKKITSSNPVRHVLNSDGKTYTLHSLLQTQFTDLDDDGELICKVNLVQENNIQKEISVDSGKLTVYYAPKWNSTSNIVFAEENTEATLTCLVKSNPPTNEIIWYQSGNSKELIKGESLKFQNVSSKNFSIFECAADNGVGSAVKFRVELKESGPPEQFSALTLSNSTSDIIPLQWKIGSDGGHPPLTYSIKLRETGYRDYKTVNDSIRQIGLEGDSMTYNIIGLNPSTLYEFIVVAKNSRKDHFPEKENTSPEMKTGGKTKVTPEVTITDVTIERGYMTVTWNYDSIKKQLDPKNYEVILKIKYQRLGKADSKYKTFPTENTLLVGKGSARIEGNFLPNDPYNVSLMLYENGHFCCISMMSPEQPPKSAALPLWAIILIACITGIVLVSVIVGTVLLCLHKHKSASKLKQKKNIEISRPAPYIKGISISGDKSAGVLDEASEKDDAGEACYEEIPDQHYTSSKGPKLPKRNNMTVSNKAHGSSYLLLKAAQTTDGSQTNVNQDSPPSLGKGSVPFSRATFPTNRKMYEEEGKEQEKHLLSKLNGEPAVSNDEGESDYLNPVQTLKRGPGNVNLDPLPSVKYGNIPNRSATVPTSARLMNNTGNE